MQGVDRLLSMTSTAGVSMAYSAMQVDMLCKTIACGRYALATARVLDRAIGCSSPPASATRRTVFSASSRLRIRVHRRTTLTMSSQTERVIEASGEKYPAKQKLKTLLQPRVLLEKFR